MYPRLQVAHAMSTESTCYDDSGFSREVMRRMFLSSVGFELKRWCCSQESGSLSSRGAQTKACVPGLAESLQVSNAMTKGAAYGFISVATPGG